MLISAKKCLQCRSRKFRSPAAAILVLAWVALFQAACLFHAASPSTGPIAVRQTEGEVHGFLQFLPLPHAVAPGRDAQFGQSGTRIVPVHIGDSAAIDTPVEKHGVDGIGGHSD